MKTLHRACWWLVAGSCLLSTLAAGRDTRSLDGTWRLADSVSATAMPADFPATVPVPGLANLARPKPEAVDAFISRENLANQVRAMRC